MIYDTFYIQATPDNSFTGPVLLSGLLSAGTSLSYTFNPQFYSKDVALYRKAFEKRAPGKEYKVFGLQYANETADASNKCWLINSADHDVILEAVKNNCPFILLGLLSECSQFLEDNNITYFDAISPNLLKLQYKIVRNFKEGLIQSMVPELEGILADFSQNEEAVADIIKHNAAAAKTNKIKTTKLPPRIVHITELNDDILRDVSTLSSKDFVTIKLLQPWSDKHKEIYDAIKGTKAKIIVGHTAPNTLKKPMRIDYHLLYAHFITEFPVVDLRSEWSNNVNILLQAYDIDLINAVYKNKHFVSALPIDHQEIKTPATNKEYKDTVFSDYNFNGYPYDNSIFDRTGLSIVAERHVHGSFNFITELTYSNILNHNPFILFASKASYEHLHSLGFRTFDEICDFSKSIARINYNMGRTDFNAIVTHMVTVKDEIHKNPVLVKEITVHNYNVLRKVKNPFKDYQTLYRVLNIGSDK